MSSDKVIVRGISEDFFDDNFIDMKIYFGGSPIGVPAVDADYIGFYVEAPASAITHIGIVDHIEFKTDGKIYHLKAIIKLDEPIKTNDGHPIRKHEYWTLEELGIKWLSFVFNDKVVVGK